MRHRALGRHARYRSKPGIRTYLIALAAALALLGGSLLASGTFAAQASVAAPKAAARPVQAEAVVTVRSALDKAALHRAAATSSARAAAARRAAATSARYTIRSGDVLSNISARFCGSPARYPDLAGSNGIANPDVIIAGHWLGVSTRDCDHAPATTLMAHTAMTSENVTARSYNSRSAHATTGRTWGVTRGYPNYCGDGDGDGWDVACSAAPAASASSDSDGDGSSHSTYHHHSYASASSSSSYSSSGTYSYAGLESLWISAGGPSWAASHAASIAECESGGNASAYNPSGATGLWQILGSVVAGNLDNPYVNALNAVSKFRASGDTFAQWVCQ